MPGRLAFAASWAAPEEKTRSWDLLEALTRRPAPWHARRPFAAEFGLAFHVEPSRLSLLHTVKAALDMTQAAPGLRYTLDFLHYHVQGVPLAQSLQLLPFAGHMHARQARAGAGKCDFFQGEIDYPAIAARMKEMGWQGDIAMEFWCSDELRAQGVLASEQNILMRCCLKRLLA